MRKDAQSACFCLPGEVALQQTLAYPLSLDFKQHASLEAFLLDHYNTVYNYVCVTKIKKFRWIAIIVCFIFSNELYCLQVARAFPYNVAVLLYSEFTTLTTNFVINYNDIFIILISVVIVHHFRILREYISRATEQVLNYRSKLLQGLNTLRKLVLNILRNIE